MYLPLKFLEMMDNYIQVPNATISQLQEVNEKSISWVQRMMENEKDFFFETYAGFKDYLIGVRKDIPYVVEDIWESLAQDYKNSVGVITPPDEDFLNLIHFTNVRNEWRMRKLVYRVSADLKEELINMKMNKLVSLNCMQNVPATCFYIDYSDSEGFAEKDNGCLVCMHTSKSVITVILTLLCDCDKVGTIIVSLGVDLRGYDAGVLLVQDEDAAEIVNMEVQGIPVVFKEKAFKRFILNFFIYLYAVNTDVQVSEKTVNTYRKPKAGVEPKNKFKEVEAFDVGFRYVSPRRNKVKYIRENDSNKLLAGKGSSKCTHYRSAHWHSYWTKEDDGKKKLIVKWVDGVMINGKEAKNVTITKI